MVPSVSVIIPVYNRAKIFKRALDCLLKQTCSDFEVVIVDDGSTDGIEQAIAAGNLPRCTFIQHSQNRGAAAARNTGIAVATGRWVAFLDSDDSWEPDKLARQIVCLTNAGSEFKACCTGYRLHRNDRVSLILPNIPPGNFRKEILFGCTISPGSTLLLDRDVFEKVGPFDERFRRLEDWDWLIRFSEHYDIKFLPAALADIYESTGSTLSGIDGVDPVFEATKLLEVKYLAGFRAQNRLSYLQFRSSLYVEIAARMYRTHRRWYACLYTTLSLFYYPKRNVAFFRTLWRSVLSMIVQSK